MDHRLVYPDLYTFSSTAPQTDDIYDYRLGSYARLNLRSSGFGNPAGLEYMWPGADHASSYLGLLHHQLTSIMKCTCQARQQVPIRLCILFTTYPQARLATA